MMRRGHIWTWCLIAVISLGAQGARAEPSDISSPSPEASPSDSTPLDLLRVETEALLDSLVEPELVYVYEIRGRDGIIRAARSIRDDLTNAIALCGVAHPDLKDALDSRFTLWQSAVTPVLESAELSLNAAIEAQTFMPEQALRDHLKRVEEAAAYTAAQREKTPLTDHAGCTYILENMPGTQANLTDLLGQTLSSIPLPEGAGIPEKPFP